MADANPELQAKLQELDHELEEGDITQKGSVNTATLAAFTMPQSRSRPVAHPHALLTKRTATKNGARYSCRNISGPNSKRNCKTTCDNRVWSAAMHRVRGAHRSRRSPGLTSRRISRFHVPTPTMTAPRRAPWAHRSIILVLPQAALGRPRSTWHIRPAK